jgi:hypothetical protein
MYFMFFEPILRRDHTYQGNGQIKCLKIGINCNNTMSRFFISKRFNLGQTLLLFEIMRLAKEIA